MGLVRLLLAASVLVSHAVSIEFDLFEGAAAVRGFYIVSGFYMALVLDKSYVGPGSTGRFYGARLTRIAVPYYAMAAVSLAALALDDIHPMIDLRGASLVWGEPAAGLALASSNLAIFGQELLYCVGLDSSGAMHWAPGGGYAYRAFAYSLVPQAWTLALEMEFYLAAPWLVRLSTARLVTVAGCSLALRLLLWQAGPGPNYFAGKFLPSELYLFLAGCLAYRVYGFVRPGKRTSWAAFTGLCLTAAMAVAYPDLSGAWRFPVFAVLLAFSLPFVFMVFKDSAADRFLGGLSYPVYLTHFLILALVEDLWGWENPWLAGGTCLVGALVFWAVVERPLERWRRARFSRVRPEAVMVLEGPVGTGGVGVPVPATSPGTAFSAGSGRIR